MDAAGHRRGAMVVVAAWVGEQACWVALGFAPAYGKDLPMDDWPSGAVCLGAIAGAGLAVLGLKRTVDAARRCGGHGGGGGRSGGGRARRDDVSVTGSARK